MRIILQGGERLLRVKWMTLWWGDWKSATYTLSKSDLGVGAINDLKWLTFSIDVLNCTVRSNYSNTHVLGCQITVQFSTIQYMASTPRNVHYNLVHGFKLVYLLATYYPFLLCQPSTPCTLPFSLFIVSSDLHPLSSLFRIRFSSFLSFLSQPLPLTFFACQE